MIQRTNTALRRILSKNAFVRGVSVSVDGTAAAQRISVRAAPLLTRLHSPEDFGQAPAARGGARTARAAVP